MMGLSLNLSRVRRIRIRTFEPLKEVVVNPKKKKLNPNLNPEHVDPKDQSPRVGDNVNIRALQPTIEETSGLASDLLNIGGWS